MDSADEKRQKICYLFLSLEGPITETNLTRFNQMGVNLDGFVESRNSIIAECNRIIEKLVDKDARYDAIFEEINNIADSMYILSDEAEKRRLLWMLESLAWHDDRYTENEKKFIFQLAQKWKIDPSLVIEMEDIAETLIMIGDYRRTLNAFRNRVKTTGVVLKDSYRSYKNGIISRILLFFKVWKNARGFPNYTDKTYDFINSLTRELDNNQKDITDNIAHIINLG
jgi:uncharacterized protein YoxC